MPPVVLVKSKRKARPKIEWTAEMIAKLKTDYPCRFNKDVAKELGIGWRSLVRKARELGVEKEPDFLDINRSKIVQLIAAVRKPNPSQACKGFIIPNSEKYRFKKGHVPPTKTDGELVKRIHEKRNDTIRRERLRMRYGLSRITKLKLNAV
jgi:hypothetical protein